MRVFAAFGAFVALVALPSWVGAVTPPLPDGPWKLRICLTVGPTTNTPCAYLDGRLILRVERATSAANSERKVLFEQTIPAPLAQKIYEHALSAIRSVGSVPGHPVLDGTDLDIWLAINATSAEIHLMGVNIADTGRDGSELVRLLHETVPDAF